jgi:hypothetical protein
VALQEWDNRIADLMNCGLSDEEIPEYFNATEASQFIRDYCAKYRRADSDDTSVTIDDAWSEHPIWVRLEWVREVTSQDTQLGYWAWVVHQLERAPDHCDHRGRFRLTRPGATIELADYKVLLRCVGKLLPGAANLSNGTSLQEIGELAASNNWNLEQYGEQDP